MWLLRKCRLTCRRAFEDIGFLYELPSRLIHGSGFSEKGPDKAATSITTVPDDSPSREAVAHTVDRLRDLARRALLARNCLAAGDPPLWNLNEDQGVDALLANASTQKEWRSKWRDVLRSFDAHGSVDQPRTAVSFVSQEDR